jgi:dTDP-4-dehydrorhamnose reductase
MKVLVTGSGGQLGRATVACCVAAGDDVVAAEHATLDISDRDAVLAAVTSLRPDLVVNAAAFTDVDGCERDPDRAFAANALAVRHLAEACRRADAHLVHVSTDYVFDGRKGAPYIEWDDTGPLSVYGRSKLAGEHEAGPGTTVVRTAWVFSGGDRNFVRTVLDRAAADEPLRFIDDQLGSPTLAGDLAAVLRRLGVSRAPGVFHATNAGATSRYEQARCVLRAAGMDPDRVEAISSAELPWVAERPAATVLDNAALRLSDVPALRHHVDAIEEVVKELHR